MLGLDPKPEVREDLDLRRHPEEDEEWFQRLSPDFQEAARQRWLEREQKLEDWDLRARHSALKTKLSGVLCTALPIWGLGASGWPLLLSLPMGWAVGQVWLAARAGQLSSGLYCGGWVALSLFLGGLFTRAQDAGGFVFTVYATLLGMILGAIAGLRRDMDHWELDY